MYEYQTDMWKLRSVYTNFPFLQHITCTLLLSTLCNRLIIGYWIKKTMNKVTSSPVKWCKDDDFLWFPFSCYCGSEWLTVLLRQQKCCNWKLGWKSRHWSCLGGCHSVFKAFFKVKPVTLEFEKNYHTLTTPFYWRLWLSSILAF